VSATDQIFFRTELDPEAAARAIADALGCEFEKSDRGVFLGRDKVGGLTDYFAGQVSVNYLGDPDNPPGERSAIDDYPLVWAVHKKGGYDPDQQLRGARALAGEMIEKLAWPLLLVHELEIAVLAWSPEDGLIEFPADTSVDAEQFSGAP
jgi:hypothetical protein